MSAPGAGEVPSPAPTCLTESDGRCRKRRAHGEMIMKTALALCAAGALSCLATSPMAHAQASDIRAEADSKARAIVDKLTLDEKVAQLLNVAPAIPRLGIPAYNWWTESLHGAIGAVPTTNFPEPTGLAATFDAPLIHQVAAAIGTEVRALH